MHERWYVPECDCQTGANSAGTFPAARAGDGESLRRSVTWHPWHLSGEKVERLGMALEQHQGKRPWQVMARVVLS